MKFTQSLSAVVVFATLASARSARQPIRRQDAAADAAAAAAGGAAGAAAAGAAGAAAGAAAGGDPQTATTLDPSVIAAGFNNNGQDPPVAGQTASLTSTNNFINFCVGKTITDGKQIKEGSCNPCPIGDIPTFDNMPSAKFIFPPNNDNSVQPNTAFTIKMNIQKMQTGVFTNAQQNYFAAPQQLNGQGQIIGHTHFTVEELPDGVTQTNPLDSRDFVFFKGINDPDAGGVASAAVDDGLPAGSYRVCSINSAANHQPVIVPVAQHGSLDDCSYFTIGGAAAAGAAAGAANNAAAGAAAGAADAGAAAGAAGAAAGAAGAAAGAADAGAAAGAAGAAAGAANQGAAAGGAAAGANGAAAAGQGAQAGAQGQGAQGAQGQGQQGGAQGQGAQGAQGQGAQGQGQQGGAQGQGAQGAQGQGAQGAQGQGAQGQGQQGGAQGQGAQGQGQQGGAQGQGAQGQGRQGGQGGQGGQRGGNNNRRFVRFAREN